MELADGVSTETLKVFAAAGQERVYKLEGHERIEWECRVLDSYDVVMTSQVSCPGLQRGRDRVLEVTERERSSEFSGYLDLGVDHAGWLEGLGAPSTPSGRSSPAVLKLAFDNTYSFFTAKRVEVRLKKVPGAAPKVSSYLKAIAACEAGGRWERAAALLGRMRAVRLPADTQCHNAAIDACRAAGRWREALGLLAAMRSTGPAADARSYEAAVAACEAGGQAEQALDLIKEMGAAFPGARPGAPGRLRGRRADASEDLEWLRQVLNEAMSRCPRGEAGEDLRGHLTAAMGSLQGYSRALRAG